MKKTNKRRIGFVLCFLLGCLATAIPMILSQGPEQSHPASQVSPGTFKTGDYIYPNNLRINGNLDMDNGAITNIDWINSDDGSGSGLDADNLDGHDTSYFQREVGSDCGASNYVYGVADDGTLRCRVDQSGGAANDISCTDCVALGTETTGGYAGSSSEGGAASDLTCITCISTGEIADSQVTEAKTAQNTLDDSEIEDNSLTASSLAADSVDASELVASYESGSAYDSRFVNVGGDTMSGDLTTSGKINGVMFGSWASRSINTVYQAASDGFVMAFVIAPQGFEFCINGKTDSANPPTTVRAYACPDWNGDATAPASITMPVRKNDYWNVSVPSPTLNQAVYWIPLGG